MIRQFRQITIIKARKQPDTSINTEIKWLAESLGLFNSRDKENSCYRIFITLLKERRGLTSDELAYKLNLSRGTIVHHLKKILETGAITTEHNKYFLRSENLQKTMEQIQQDIENTIKEMKETAKEVDKKLGF